MADKPGPKNRSKNKESSLEGEGVAARRTALKALLRIEKDGAYANLVLPEILDRSGLSLEDRRFTTELVYGTTRMRRPCDFLVDRFLLGEADPQVRAALRLGAYQLRYMRTPAHAAVSATVGAVSGRGGSLVNAVLRKVAAETEVAFPNVETELSYPDWIVARLVADLGEVDALLSLRAMNKAASTSTREDGYIQDEASQQVVEIVAAAPGELIVDLCAAPGGKATGLAAKGATVLALDLRLNRTRLIARNVAKLKSTVSVVNADGTAPPLRANAADKVLIDAPCSGLGSLRRRADARWRIDEAAPKRLAKLQVDLVLAGLDVLRPGGVLTYSVCTLTALEGRVVLEQVVQNYPNLDVVTEPVPGWQLNSGVARLLPADTDGMTLWQLRKQARRIKMATGAATSDADTPVKVGDEASLSAEEQPVDKEAQRYEIINCWT